MNEAEYLMKNYGDRGGPLRHFASFWTWNFTPIFNKIVNN